MESSYFLIGADIVPTKSNTELFNSGDVDKLVGLELKSVLSQADYRIFNLEVPLTDKTNSPIRKNGPSLSAPVSTINGYKSLGIDVLSLANNHILDQGDSGLKSTVNVLDNAGITHVGAGDNIYLAAKPYKFTFGNKKIGVYACAEHEFSIATTTKAGANPFNILYSFDHVEVLKEETDYVIVLYHGGKEHYRYPSPNLQKICRRFIEKGADLVICQHSHCIGCEEDYAGGKIVYGQGNFIFDDKKNECWETSLLIKVDEGLNISYIPIERKNNTVRIANNNSSQDILAAFALRSEEIKKPGFIEQNYVQLANAHFMKYLNGLSGKRSILFRIANRSIGGKLNKYYLKKAYKAESFIRISNYVDCESHRELLSKGLENQFTKQ